MFTGLIKTQGEVRRVDQRGDRLMMIAMREAFPVEIGDSVACNGICLTAVKVNGHEFKVSLSAETLARTTAADWGTGTLINLEPSLKVGDALGGHFVSGHVDGVSRVLRREESGDSTVWEFDIPAGLARFIAAKGSVAINGVSLTVNTVLGNNSFFVNIIPHTAEVTNFKTLQAGDKVNLEIDMLARYAARALEVK